MAPGEKTASRRASLDRAWASSPAVQVLLRELSLLGDRRDQISDHTDALLAPLGGGAVPADLQEDITHLLRRTIAVGASSRAIEQLFIENGKSPMIGASTRRALDVVIRSASSIARWASQHRALLEDELVETAKLVLTGGAPTPRYHCREAPPKKTEHADDCSGAKTISMDVCTPTRVHSPAIAPSTRPRRAGAGTGVAMLTYDARGNSTTSKKIRGL